MCVRASLGTVHRASRDGSDSQRCDEAESGVGGCSVRSVRARRHTGQLSALFRLHLRAGRLQPIKSEASAGRGTAVPASARAPLFAHTSAHTRDPFWLTPSPPQIVHHHPLNATRHPFSSPACHPSGTPTRFTPHRSSSPRFLLAPPPRTAPPSPRSSFPASRPSCPRPPPPPSRSSCPRRLVFPCSAQQWRRRLGWPRNECGLILKNEPYTSW